MAKDIITYSKIDSLPQGTAPDTVTPGCIVLEGGAWRGLYTQGALDALQEAGILFQTTIGVSAGAMSGIGYVSGQIGWTARFNLTHRKNPEYCGTGALKRDHGVTGFSYLYDNILKSGNLLDRKRFRDPSRRLVVVATNMETGKPEYFEKGKDRIFRAVRASATVPYVSKPVMIDGIPYLDGGCSVKIPYDWAVEQGFEKIMVIRTRDRSYHKPEKKENAADRFLYHKYPEFVAGMIQGQKDYDELLYRMDEDQKAGKCFVLAPKEPMDLKRFEGDLEKLGDRYWRGYNEMKEQLPALRSYLGMES
ncbi:MAG: patatin family protein [Lachnospiraceae bacterium]|nr:patatin family protein [Lachnospiraceae bacterium]